MKKLTALAQLVAIYAKHEGVTSTAKLAELTGYSERSIWKAKAELRDTEAECTLNPASLNPASVHPEAECSPPLNSGAVPRARVSYTEDSIIKQQHHQYDAAREDVVDDVCADDFALEKQLRDAAVSQPINHFAASMANVEPIRDLIREGFSLEAQILPTIRKHRAKPNEVISSWKFFATIVRSKHTAPTGKPKTIRYCQEEWEPGELVSSYA